MGSTTSPLDPESLLQRARERLGDPALDSHALAPGFEQSFAVLLKALREEARLSPAGRQRAHDRLVDQLCQRSALATYEAAHAGPDAAAIERPLVITGFPRTGTSLLHNLLARVPGIWAPPLWQLRAPLAKASGSSEAAAAAREDTRAFLDALYTAAPELRTIRLMDADWPDECNWLLGPSFTTLVNAFRYFVPSYVRHLRGLDMRPAYADHARWLRALAQLNGRGSARLVLKDPFHLWQLEALFATYPDATVIHLHRDPAEVAPSLASLCATRQSVHTDAPRTRTEIGAYTLGLLDNGLRALERSRASLPAERFIDLPYRELIASPGEVLRRLGAKLDFATDADALERAGAWLTENRQHKAGRHRYTPEDFGFSEDILDEYFADYRSRFGLLI
ncbi:hypothetical protein PPSIR1_25886 [Plesiocystis pacifica SIR-1]|uniref:Sulfotransferase n=1 Tax=Plesiocystis pacifica SIR-1 TaxID=391625 RepID=A6FZJ1_9BACT|nr:sulfotransferase [Plesiocystis pacifica]EDM81075.1 hypothetical protein PPSIR1_25886 [Plesiocystis pacifica SIR-1]